MAAKLDIYAGQDPRELPAYPIPEAAHYLQLPTSTLRSWVVGRKYPVRGGEEWFEPLIVLPDGEPKALSFRNLVEAHILAAARRTHNVPLHAVRSALNYVREQMGVPRPLADVTFQTDGADLFVDHLGALVAVSREGQLAVRAWVHASLKRIERDEAKLAQRLWLFTREASPIDEQPKIVVVDPRREFGRPLLDATGTPTAVLRQRYKAGESIAELAADYKAPPALIEEAIRCELRRDFAAA